MQRRRAGEGIADARGFCSLRRGRLACACGRALHCRPCWGPPSLPRALAGGRQGTPQALPARRVPRCRGADPVQTGRGPGPEPAARRPAADPARAVGCGDGLGRSCSLRDAALRVGPGARRGTSGAVTGVRGRGPAGIVSPHMLCRCPVRGWSAGHLRVVCAVSRLCAPGPSQVSGVSGLSESWTVASWKVDLCVSACVQWTCSGERPITSQG